MRIVDGHRATDEGTVYRKPAGTVPPDAPTDEIITNHDNKVTANEAENDEDTDTSIFQGATALAKKVLIAIIKELILLIHVGGRHGDAGDDPGPGLHEEDVPDVL